MNYSKSTKDSAWNGGTLDDVQTESEASLDADAEELQDELTNVKRYSAGGATDCLSKRLRAAANHVAPSLHGRLNGVCEDRGDVLDGGVGDAGGEAAVAEQQQQQQQQRLRTILSVDRQGSTDSEGKPDSISSSSSSSRSSGGGSRSSNSSSRKRSHVSWADEVQSDGGGGGRASGFCVESSTDANSPEAGRGSPARAGSPASIVGPRARAGSPDVAPLSPPRPQLSSLELQSSTESLSSLDTMMAVVAKSAKSVLPSLPREPPTEIRCYFPGCGRVFTNRSDFGKHRRLGTPQADATVAGRAPSPTRPAPAGRVAAGAATGGAPSARNGVRSLLPALQVPQTTRSRSTSRHGYTHEGIRRLLRVRSARHRRRRRPRGRLASVRRAQLGCL
ncbi:PREDICTED: uncharacterized protein LOC106821604 [Priapulus caudatus]|uniref:Uncharacterized protein LOC106821604 n=1 Tax=Priapulus caudatus TaxID=37621 RepID=A0ABM1FC01_PRICU|nr:PREDICTED: uncharacterized protein LOC106821604 [Priapulus caudatus]